VLVKVSYAFYLVDLSESNTCNLDKTRKCILNRYLLVPDFQWASFGTPIVFFSFILFLLEYILIHRKKETPVLRSSKLFLGVKL